MKRNLILTLILIFVLSLSACCFSPSQPDHPLVRVVTRICISRDDDIRSYSSDESMGAILAYLRHLSPGSSSQPLPSQGSIYRISLIYSDGSREDFLQQGKFFQDAEGTWKSITEQDMLNLSKLFALLEPETAPPAM